MISNIQIKRKNVSELRGFIIRLVAVKGVCTLLESHVRILSLRLALTKWMSLIDTRSMITFSESF